MERSPDAILTNDPFPIGLGDHVFKVKRLPIAKAKAWRARVIEFDASLASQFSEEDPLKRVAAISDKTPDLIGDLVFDFLEKQSGDKVTREQLENATDEQLMGIYQRLLEISFPNGVLSAGTSILRRILI